MNESIRNDKWAMLVSLSHPPHISDRYESCYWKIVSNCIKLFDQHTKKNVRNKRTNESILLRMMNMNASLLLAIRLLVGSSKQLCFARRASDSNCSQWMKPNKRLTTTSNNNNKRAKQFVANIKIAIERVRAWHIVALRREYHPILYPYEIETVRMNELHTL